MKRVYTIQVVIEDDTGEAATKGRVQAMDIYAQEMLERLQLQQVPYPYQRTITMQGPA